MSHRIALLILSATAAPLAAQGIAPGRWDVTSTGVDLTIPGTPGFMLRMMRGKSQTERKCLTPEQAKTGMAALLVPKPAAKCRVDRAIVADGRIDHAMLCPQKEGDPLRVTRVGTYTDTGFALRMTMAGTTPKGQLRIVADQVARHAGPKCS